MSLSDKQFKELEIMMADKKAAAEMRDAMTSDGTLSARTKAVLDIALASKKRGDDVAAQIAAAGGSVSAENEKVLDVAAASKATGDALESEIES